MSQTFRNRWSSSGRWIVMAIGVAGITFSSKCAAAERSIPDSLLETSTLFLKAHCFECHGRDEQSGDVRFDDLTGDLGNEAARWTAIRDQLRDGLMPPPDEPQPDPRETRKLVVGLTAELGIQPARLPNQGNLIPHELLFGQPATGDSASQPRIWRLSPEAYANSIRPLFKENLGGIVNPFVFGGGRGIQDFAQLHNVDEAVTEVLMRNAAVIVDAQTSFLLRDGKYEPGNHGAHREFVELMNPAIEPTLQQLEAAIQSQFSKAIRRPASSAELSRYRALYEKCAAGGNRPAALKTMLQAIILRPDAIYRFELGLGPEASGNRRMLSPTELEQAVSLSVGNSRDPNFIPALVDAAAKGESAIKEAVAARVGSAFDDPKGDKAHALKFFNEYFDYYTAPSIFKAETHQHEAKPPYHHDAAWLVNDTDHLVRYILNQDRDVFRQLLTTPLAFVNFTLMEDKQTRVVNVPAMAMKPHRADVRGLEYIYGFDEWPVSQPVTLPEGTRIGVLMQPSWLQARSTNFDNDPVRRGRWIRERLLGGTVPDLPIGVAAMVPDEPHRTFRDRLAVTRDAKCWKCHQKMDELGLPFEDFDHYGRQRLTETVRDLEATAKNVDKQGKPLGPVTREVPLNTSGTIADSGDPNLDGPVKDAREMLVKIAYSDRARQVFIRHVFRYYMGRNEGLSDAKALQEADQAYVASGGSFKALLVSLLTSPRTHRMTRSLRSAGGNCQSTSAPLVPA
jgi:hypothetical protein